jgi:glycosyltransferase involved in cell wall biosynthesis
LIQGGAAPGRGFEVVLEGWRRLANPAALLYIRCPENPYLNDLKLAYSDLVKRRLVFFIPAVQVADLMQAATFADVGIIPYPAKLGSYTHNINHAYCCPNKLSQYMQAGLCILSANTAFVADCLDKYKCGLSYDPDNFDAFARAVNTLISDPHLLASLQHQSRQWACAEFNWEFQSIEYRSLIAKLLRP